MTQHSAGEPYYTLAAYRRQNAPPLTAAMEDYLEMICRFTQRDGHARINALAERLGVRPSSASKMVTTLKGLGLVEFERYALVTPSPQGWEIGEQLLRRHTLLLRFFTALNGGNQLEQVERVEHFLSDESLQNLERLLPLLEGQQAAPPSGF